MVNGRDMRASSWHPVELTVAWRLRDPVRRKLSPPSWSKQSAAGKARAIHFRYDAVDLFAICLAPLAGFISP
jgi:hypothetical protein